MCGVVLDEGCKEARGTREEGVGRRRKGAGARDALGDKEVCGRGWRWERDGARASADGASGEYIWRLGWKGCTFCA